MGGNGSTVPAGDGIKRRIQPCVASQLSQAKNVRDSLAGPTRAVLVFQLHTDDRSAIFPEEPFGLFADLLVEARDVLQVNGIVFPGGGFLKEPVGQAAVPCLPVSPRPNANPHIQAMFCAKLDKPAQIALSRPVKLSLDLLVMNPKDVGRDNLDSASFHLQDLFFPSICRITGVMKLAHDREPRLSIAKQETRVGRKAMAVGGGSAQRER